MQIRYGALDFGDGGSKVGALQASRNSDLTLQVIAADFGLPGNGDLVGEGPEGSGFSAAAGQQSVTQSLNGSAVGGGKADAEGVGVVVCDHRNRRRLAFNHSGGGGGNLFWRESRASGDRRIDLKHDGRTPYCVIDAGPHVDHT